MHNHGFPFWGTDKAAICAAIERRQARLKFLLKTKDETHFIDEWIAHYAAIVGIENLIIFDNMSTDETVLQKYRDYGRALMVFRYDGFHNHIHNVEAFPQLYGALARSCDYVMFVDSDEFVTVLDRGRHADGQAVADFILSAGTFDILPGTWLENLPRSKTLFECGTALEKYQWGLRWGKPALRTKANLRGILLHNTQGIAALSLPGTPLNLFVRHLKSLYPEQRLRTNIAKLAKRGVCAATDTAEDIVRKDLSVLEDYAARLYVSELKEILTGASAAQALMGTGTFELQADGRIAFYSAREQDLLTRYLGEDGQLILAKCVELERDGVSGGAPAPTRAGTRREGTPAAAAEGALPAAPPLPAAIGVAAVGTTHSKQALLARAQARAAIAARDHAVGVESLQAALVLDPANLGLHAEFVWELLQLGLLDEAEQACAVALARAPAHPDFLLRLGLIALRRGDCAIARGHFEAALRAAPGNPWAQKELDTDGEGAMSDIEKQVEIVARPWIKSTYYETAEEWTHLFWSKHSIFYRLFDRLDLSHVLELACGHGRHVPNYLGYAKKIVLMDVLEENIAACRARFPSTENIKFLVNNGYDFRPIHNRELTAIFCYDAMVHFSPDLVRSYLLDGARVLKHGGLMLLHHSNFDAPHDQHYGRNPLARNRMNETILRGFASEARLEVVESVAIKWGAFPDLDRVTLLRAPSG